MRMPAKTKKFVAELEKKSLIIFAAKPPKYSKWQVFGWLAPGYRFTVRRVYLTRWMKRLLCEREGWTEIYRSKWLRISLVIGSVVIRFVNRIWSRMATGLVCTQRCCMMKLGRFWLRQTVPLLMFQQFVKLINGATPVYVIGHSSSWSWNMGNPFTRFFWRIISRNCVLLSYIKDFPKLQKSLNVIYLIYFSARLDNITLFHVPLEQFSINSVIK